VVGASRSGVAVGKEKIQTKLVSAGYFNVLGVRPFLGRVFAANEDRSSGANPIAVISYGF
jgi:predicted permease